MNKILKTTALALTFTTLLSTSAFAQEALIPVRQTLEAKGYSVSWNQESKTVVISDGGFVVEEAVGEVITLNYDTTYADESFFTSIDEQRKAYEELSTKATVKEIGEGYFLADTEKLGEVMFRFDDKTHFHHEINRMLYKANDLQVGSVVKVYFDMAMTASLPPQTYAIEVVFMNTEVKAEENGLSQVFTVTESGEGFILASNEKMGEVMFMVDELTAFRHERNRRLYTIADVEAGAKLQITFSEAMTASLPPKTHATDVVFLDSEVEIDPVEITTSGTIVAIGENSFDVEKEDGSRVRFNTDENTYFHHVMNRMLYRFESLEEGMKVDVNHSDAMTFSLPPQSYAIEVIIK